MKELVDILIIAFAAITNAGLQLGAGTLLLLYNESLGKKVRKSTRAVTRGFIVGAFLFSILLVSAASLMILLINSHPFGENGLTVAAGALLAMSIVAICLYYRSGKNTMLWIPDFVAKYFRKRAGKADTGAEGIALGMTTVLAELPFSLMLIIVAANSLLNLPQAVIILAIASYSLIVVMPLVIMKILIRNGKNLADIQRWRVKNKTFLKIFTGICYIALAAFVIVFKILKDLG